MSGVQFLGGETADGTKYGGAPVRPSRRPQFSRARATGSTRAKGLRAATRRSTTSSCSRWVSLNFVLSFIGYRWPPDKVFDEIYFARAGEEYVQNLRIYENTHPPLTKLLVTISMMLFGGMPHGHGLGGWTGLNAIVGHMKNGDNAYGWRFLDVVFGALVVMLLYAFAKRHTGSTLFAALCRAASHRRRNALRAVADRDARRFRDLFCHVGDVYAFYRFWISSQVRRTTARRRSRMGALRRSRGALARRCGSGGRRPRRVEVRCRDDASSPCCISPAAAYLIVRYI